MMSATASQSSKAFISTSESASTPRASSLFFAFCARIERDLGFSIWSSTARPAVRATFFAPPSTALSPSKSSLCRASEPASRASTMSSSAARSKKALYRVGSARAASRRTCATISLLAAASMTGRSAAPEPSTEPGWRRESACVRAYVSIARKAVGGIPAGRNKPIASSETRLTIAVKRWS